MNFWKGSKRPLTPTSTPQNGPYLWESCACIAYYLAIIPPRIYALCDHIIKKLQNNFPKMMGGGTKAVWNSSDLVARLLQQIFPGCSPHDGPATGGFRREVFFKVKIISGELCWRAWEEVREGREAAIPQYLSPATRPYRAASLF